MPKPSYGPTLQKRVKRLLDDLLSFVNGDFPDLELRDFDWRWQQEDSDRPELVIETKISSLIFLTQKDDYSGELTKKQINPILTHYLKDFLQILSDNRTVTKGSEDWKFTLKLWSTEKSKNLQKFDEEWEAKRPNNSNQKAESVSKLNSLEAKYAEKYRKQRLPAVKTLYDILPKGTEGGKEFARIIDLLLFQEARRVGKKVTIFNDAAGDYHGLDSFEGDAFRQEGTTGYQYKFYPSPLDSTHRSEIKKSLLKTAERQEELKLKKWILITPQNLTESATRKDKGDVSWFEGLRKELNLNFELEHWGHTSLQYLFLESPVLGLYYYPEIIADGASHRKTIQDIRQRYNLGLQELHRNIEFVGMSVYKEESTRGVPMESIYIPLSVVPEASSNEDNAFRKDPLSLITLGKRNVILGDPGSGKSTLLKFLSLAGISPPLQRRYQAKSDKRLPILIILRRYADELKSRKNLSLIDYIQEVVRGDFNLTNADLNFFEFYLETGQAILFFDGLDELPNSSFKRTVKNRICTLNATYPGNTIIVTSRIVGYDSYFRFDEKEFTHYRLSNLQLPEIEQFITDWYKVRIKNQRERNIHITDLVELLKDNDYKAIRELAENPLLLTIITLVHRIDAVLPDERVVLYQKCTETLLNTWHSWKFRESDDSKKGKNKIERRNRQRMEAIANWMHCQSVGTGSKQRAVAPYEDLKEFLTKHIRDVEKSIDPDNDPEDLADEFLEFIRKRAGLLIEAGDKQYSFVHLTFQEYLTSFYIITKGERDGVKNMWQTLRTKCSDSRWQEVIRLLVASLKSDDSQEYLIEKLLLANKEKHQVNLSLLLGGLLLDGIKPAEMVEQNILADVFRSAIKVNEIEQLRPILSILRTWITKEPDNETTVKDVFSSLWEAEDDVTNRESLILIAYALKWSEAEIIELAKGAAIYPETDFSFLQLFFGDKDKIVQSDPLTKNMEFLWDAQNYCSTISPGGNFFAAVSQSLNFRLGITFFSKRIFLKYMILMNYSKISGPFRDFNYSICQLSTSKQFFNFTKLDRTRAGARAGARDRALNWAGALDRARNRAGALARARNRAGARAGALDLTLNRDRALDLTLNRDIENNEDFWEMVIIDSELYNPILELFCDIFSLEPRTQWWEALRVSCLPIIPDHIPLFDRDLWLKVEQTFVAGNPDEADIYFAAWQLLFDVWLYVSEYYDSADESMMARIADLTRSHQAPPLRIAHCIRDIAYGDKSRIDDLVAMVNSEDIEYKTIFETCYWRETQESNNS